MARQNTSIVQNFSELLPCEMLDEYDKLARHYIETKQENDVIQQQNYELKRQLERKARAEEHLNNELETMSEQQEHHQAEITKLIKNYQGKIDGLQQTVNSLNHFKENYLLLETELNCLKKEKATGPVLSALPSILSDPNDFKRQQIDKLETENGILIDKCNELNEKCMVTQTQLSDLQTSLENLQDRCECAEENLRGKRDELEEKDAMVDELNEQIAQLTTELAQFKSNASDSSKKGNSLFAELDDQRQHMRCILEKQKNRLGKYKSEHENSMRQIRQLKRENASMHREVKICSEMFYSANDFHRRRLSDRIYWLNQEKEALETKLKQTEEYLCRLNEGDSTWVSAMLEFCDNQTRKLQVELKCARFQKAEAEDLYVHAKEDNARWRFEALRSRCTIINRELLLEENKIAFEPLSDLEARAAVQKRFPDVTKETPQIFGAIDQSQTVPEHPPVETKVIDENSSNATKIIDEPLPIANGSNDDVYVDGNRTIEITQSSDVDKQSTSNVSIMQNIVNRFGQCHIDSPPRVSIGSNTPKSNKYDKENIEIINTELIPGRENQQNSEHLSKVTGTQDASSGVTLLVPQYRPIKMTPSRRELIRNIRDSAICTEPPSRRSLQFSTITDTGTVPNEKKEKILAPKSFFTIKHVHLTKENPSVVINLDSTVNTNNHNETKN